MDTTSQRWAVAIALVTGLLLASMALRAQDSGGAAVGPGNGARLAAWDPPRPLEDRLHAWVTARPDGGWRVRERSWPTDRLRATQAAVAAEVEPWPDAPLLLALAWRESRLRPRAVGDLGEVGLAQLHPRYHRGDLADPAANLRIAAERLVVDLDACGDHGRALRRYATGACGAATWAERLVLRWAAELRGAQDDGSWSAAGGS